MNDITIDDLVDLDSEDTREMLRGEMTRLALQAEAKRQFAALESAGKYRKINLTNDRDIPPGTDYLIDGMMPVRRVRPGHGAEEDGQDDPDAQPH